MQSTAEDSPVDATQPSEPGPLSTEQINLVDEPEAGAPNTEESQTESKLDQFFTESNEGDFFENIARDNVEQEVSNPQRQRRIKNSKIFSPVLITKMARILIFFNNHSIMLQR